MPGSVGMLFMAAAVAAVASQQTADKAELVPKIAAEMQKCWSLPAGIDGSVVVTARFAPDGSLDGSPTAEGDAAAPAAKALAQSAVRAVIRCQPYAVLPQSGVPYEVWREMKITFDANDM